MSDVRLPAGTPPGAQTKGSSPLKSAAPSSRPGASTAADGRTANMASAVSPALSGGAVGGLVALLNNKLGKKNKAEANAQSPQVKSVSSAQASTHAPIQSAPQSKGVQTSNRPGSIWPALGSLGTNIGKKLGL